MRVAPYVRVSTERQQQVWRLREYVASQEGRSVEEQHIYRDDGYSGANLSRPSLDALRDQDARAALDRALITPPDRLARNYVHQMVIWEELERVGCALERFQTARIDGLLLPGGLRQEELQALNLSMLGTADRLGADEGGQGLVPVAGQELALQVVTKTTALGE